MLELHCHLCHGWKYSYDDYCGGDFCLKMERYFIKKKQTREAKTDIDTSNYELSTRG